MLHSSACIAMTTSGQFAPPDRRGLLFLRNNQRPYGEFRTYASPSVDMRRTFFDSSIFATTFVLYSIARIDHPCVTAMTNKAISFLTEEMYGPGLFQYYTSRSDRSTDFDLDDTACASVALLRRHPFIARGYNVRYFTKNRNEAGLFYTWVGGGARANDVDSVVNANVVLYLGDSDETKGACQYLIDTIKSSHESDSYHYYLDNMTLYYAVSRAYAHGTRSLSGAREAIVDKVLQSSKDDGSFGNELATACAVCSLANFEYDGITRLRDAARYLEGQQRADGSWRRVAMFCGSGVYYGSEELTTALCIEALTHVAGEV
jgi:prenyltransferase beta subunit